MNQPTIRKLRYKLLWLFIIMISILPFVSFFNSLFTLSICVLYTCRIINTIVSYFNYKNNANTQIDKDEYPSSDEEYLSSDSDNYNGADSDSDDFCMTPFD